MLLDFCDIWITRLALECVFAKHLPLLAEVLVVPIGPTIFVVCNVNCLPGLRSARQVLFNLFQWIACLVVVEIHSVLFGCILAGQFLLSCWFFLLLWHSSFPVVFLAWAFLVGFLLAEGTRLWVPALASCQEVDSAQMVLLAIVPA